MRLNAAEKSRAADKCRERLQAAEKSSATLQRISHLQPWARNV
jgi:hypothetical protein